MWVNYNKTLNLGIENLEFRDSKENVKRLLVYGKEVIKEEGEVWIDWFCPPGLIYETRDAWSHLGD